MALEHAGEPFEQKHSTINGRGEWHSGGMIRSVRVIVPGAPMGKQRPRVSFRHGKAIAYTPARTIQWEHFAADIMAREHKGEPFDGPLSLHVLAVAHRPKRLMRKGDPPGRILRTTKPDGDNVLKCCADALQKAGVIRDDCHIAAWSCLGYYAAKEEGPQVIIEVKQMKPQ
jgi:Holliday junction resolvase RusA-like endonuclease